MISSQHVTTPPADSTVPRHSPAGRERKRQMISAIQATLAATAAVKANSEKSASKPGVWRAMLRAILGGTPVMMAIHPIQTTQAVAENTMTANQSRALIRPRRSVGSASAASIAHGMTSARYSASIGSRVASSMARPASISATGICTWGECR